jgi:hypothetical protein
MLENILAPIVVRCYIISNTNIIKLSNIPIHSFYKWQFLCHCTLLYLKVLGGHVATLYQTESHQHLIEKKNEYNIVLCFVLRCEESLILEWLVFHLPKTNVVNLLFFLLLMFLGTSLPRLER